MKHIIILLALICAPSAAFAQAGPLLRQNNLADVPNKPLARVELGLSYGTTAGTVVQGNDSRLLSALQASAIPAAAGQLLGGTSTAGQAAAVSVGPGLQLSSSLSLLPASAGNLGGVKPGSGVSIDSSGMLTVTGTAGVGSFNGRTGVVGLLSADVLTALGYAALGPAAIPAASGQLLGGTSTAGAAQPITVGTGLNLTGGVLATTGSGGGGASPTAPNTWSAPQTFTTVLAGLEPKTADYTLTAADCGQVIVFSGAATQTVTVPSGLGLTSACMVTLVQDGVGAVAVAAGSGATLRSPHSYSRISTQGGAIGLSLLKANTWFLSGDGA